MTLYAEWLHILAWGYLSLSFLFGVIIISSMNFQCVKAMN